MSRRFWVVTFAAIVVVIAVGTLPKMFRDRAAERTREARARADDEAAQAARRAARPGCEAKLARIAKLADAVTALPRAYHHSGSSFEARRTALLFENQLPDPTVPGLLPLGPGGETLPNAANDLRAGVDPDVACANLRWIGVLRTAKYQAPVIASTPQRRGIYDGDLFVFDLEGGAAPVAESHIALTLDSHPQDRSDDDARASLGRRISIWAGFVMGFRPE